MYYKDRPKRSHTDAAEPGDTIQVRGENGELHTMHTKENDLVKNPFLGMRLHEKRNLKGETYEVIMIKKYR